MTTRRKAIEKMFKAGTAIGFSGVLWGVSASAEAETQVTLRPPGAFENDNDFVQACIKCGKCVEVCPYDTLELSTPGEGHAAGTPYFKPREIPCYMCEDIPCTNHCPSGALDIKRLTDENETATINKSEMGVAVIHKEACLASWGIQCDVCYRACPLIDKALTIEKEKNTVTGKHANLLPVVNSDYCTGCGICEHVCVTEKAAIFVLPKELATGDVSNHYIKSWEKSDEKRIDPNKEMNKTSEDSELDYLNDEEELY